MVSDATRYTLELHRKHLVAKAEKDSGFKEGMWLMGRGSAQRKVKTEVTFYPEPQWFISDCDLWGRKPKNRRPLTKEEWAKCRPWV
jgi:hypothetical protein